MEWKHTARAVIPELYLSDNVDGRARMFSAFTASANDVQVLELAWEMSEILLLVLTSDDERKNVRGWHVDVYFPRTKTEGECRRFLLDYL